jgi:glycosyltransferase involved in cell wall biosynthesis
MQSFGKYNSLFLKDADNNRSVYNDGQYPKVAIIIPTYNCSQLISLTLESLLTQHYPNYEVIIIDAESDDRTLEVVNSFKDKRISVYSVSSFRRYEMLNKGIAQSTAQYVNFLFPGDYYIGNEALRIMMDLALEHGCPSMVFCGTLLRPGREDPKILFRHLSLSLLKKGVQPTSLQSCWFHKNTFDQIGKFNTDLSLRGGFDFLCRFCLNRLCAVSTRRVLTDFDLRAIARSQVIVHFKETLGVIRHYFGWGAAFKWLCIQKDAYRFVKLWLSSVKIAFVGSKK